MANFEAFRWIILLIANFLFMKSAAVLIIHNCDKLVTTKYSPKREFFLLYFFQEGP